jgi:DNA-binding NarL/FixJ family response regulator
VGNPAAGSTLSRVAADWPLTGRAEELRLVRELERAREGSSGVVLAGAAGVGKTRLAREALAAAARRGAVVHWAVATASTRAVPLGALGALIGSVASDPAQLVRAAGAALRAGAGRAGAVLGVDDAHLLDDLSAALVHQLVLHRVVTVVLTLRTGEPARDAVTALWKDGHLQRIELQPLSADETNELLEAVLGGPVEGDTARRLWSITRGNALYLRHLVDGEREAGRLAPTAGAWRWTGRPRLSPGLQVLVRDRVGALAAAERDVVELLAFGEPLGVSLLAALADPGAVEQVESRGLVQVSRDGRRLEARLAHPLYGEVQRARCGEVRARRLRGRIAAALAGTGTRRAGDTLRQAVLAVDSDLAPDPELFAAAAGRAVELLDIPLAVRLTSAAVAAGAGLGTRLLLGYALGWSGRDADAEEVFAESSRLALTADERAQVAISRAAGLFFPLARPAEALAVLDAAERLAPDPPVATELRAVRVLLDAFLARPTPAAEAARILDDARSSAGAVTLAGWAMAAVSGGKGRLGGLAECVERAYASTGTFATGHVRSGIADMWVRALLLAGRVAEAEAAVREYVEPFDDLGSPARNFVVWLDARIARERGRVATAVRLLREFTSTWRYAADLGGLVLLVAPLATTGDAAAARAALADAEAHQHPGFAYMQPDLLLARAWVAAAEGAVSEAVAAARDAAALAAGQGQPAVEVTALHAAVQFGDRTVAARLVELAELVDGPRAPAAAAHACALAAGDVEGLLAASERLEQLGVLLPATDAAAQAAALAAAHGRRGAASLASARAQRLAQACEGARTPALAAVAAPLPLTAREREIATLAADGLSNRQIAERLTVSVRTVEGHLYRACTKLGVTHRADLAALIRG